MYRRKDTTQREFESFHLQFGGRLRSSNRWIRMAKLVPWDRIEEIYAEPFSTTGSPAINARIALGSLIVKAKLGLTDRETVEQIQENPYIQFFLGYESFQNEEPFDPSMMVHFRKRFSLDEVGEINEMIIKAATGGMVADTDDDDDDDDQTSGSGTEEGEPNEQPHSTSESQQSTRERPNKGKLLADASCAPADIRYPTDLSILNEAREKTEDIIDALHRPDMGNTIKPRTYRQKARKDFLAIAKKRKPRRKAIRRAIGKQLRYLRRNLGHIRTLGTPERLQLLTPYEYRCLLVVNEVYRQQEEMYREGKNTISNRIVSIRQPHVRPIVRGKVAKPVEFGAKFSISRVDDLVYLDRLSWEAYHEAGDIPGQVEQFFRRHGHYPESVHVDAIYRTRDNIRYCRERGIRISGPPLGRPKKDAIERKQDRKQIRLDEIDRIAIEGSFGVGKRRYTLDRILERRPDTSGSTIAVILLVMNLETLLRRFFVSFFAALSGVFHRVRSTIRAVATICWQADDPYGWSV